MTTARRIASAALASVVASAATIGIGIAGAPAAGAAPWYESGVKYVHLASEPMECVEDQPLPCPPSAGVGKSATIYVHQSLIDGEYRYTDVTGTAADPGKIWMQATVEAKCHTRHRLWSSWVTPYGEDSWGLAGQQGSDRPIPPPGSVEIQVNTENRTLALRDVDLAFGLDHFLGNELDADSSDLLDWGEAQIDQDMATGEAEQDTRGRAHRTTWNATLAATVTCRQNSGIDGWISGGLKTFETDAILTPFEVVWLAAGMEPGEEDDPNWRGAELEPPTAARPTVDGLAEGFHVEQAHLSAIEDPTNGCKLHLSGVITTNGPGDVTYRFVDELGRRSQSFSTHVDQTNSVLVDHEITFEPPSDGAAGPTGGLVAPEQHGIGGLAAEQGDNLQGWYRIEVTEPHARLSNIAGYNLGNCAAAPAPAPSGEAVPTTTLVAPTGPITAVATPTTAPTTTVPGPVTGRSTGPGRVTIGR